MTIFLLPTNMTTEFDITAFKQSINSPSDSLTDIIKYAHIKHIADDDITKAIEYMINNGNKPYGECLQKAVCFGYSKLTKLLLDNEVKLDTRDKKRNTPLINAIHTNHTDIAIYLIERGAFVNARNKFGWSGIMYACMNNNKEMVKYLIEHNADTRKIISNEHTIIDKLEKINKDNKYDSMIEYLKLLQTIKLVNNIKKN